MEDIKRFIGNRIRELRKQRGLSQEELGYKAGLHLTHIGAIERGEKNWSIDTILKVARGLNVDIKDLFDYPLDPTEAKLLKKALVEEISTSSPDVVKLMLGLLSGLKSLGLIQVSKKKNNKM